MTLPGLTEPIDLNGLHTGPAPGSPALFPVFGQKGIVRAWTTVDAEDAAAAAAHRWNFNNSYVATTVTRRDGRRESIRLHRHLMGLQYGDPRVVDHIDGNPLNNRRENLRIITPAQNSQNMRAKGGYSSHRGVTFHPKRNLWQAQCRAFNRNIFLGYYLTESDAALAARLFRQRHVPFSRDALDPTEAPWPARIRKVTTSRHVGVSWHAKSGKWQAYLTVERGRMHYLGVFEREADAASAVHYARSQATAAWEVAAHLTPEETNSGRST